MAFAQTNGDRERSVARPSRRLTAADRDRGRGARLARTVRGGTAAGQTDAASEEQGERRRVEKEFHEERPGGGGWAGTAIRDTRLTLTRIVIRIDFWAGNYEDITSLLADCFGRLVACFFVRSFGVGLVIAGIASISCQLFLIHISNLARTCCAGGVSLFVSIGFSTGTNNWRGDPKIRRKSENSCSRAGGVSRTR